jgi:hypothetical protein
MRKCNSPRILHGLPVSHRYGELAHIQDGAGTGKMAWHDRSTQPVKLRHDYPALRQLRLAKAKLAVERTLYARSAEESLLAARWASAWHKLVQRKLDQDLATLPAVLSNRHPACTQHGARCGRGSRCRRGAPCLRDQAPSRNRGDS